MQFQLLEHAIHTILQQVLLLIFLEKINKFFFRLRPLEILYNATEVKITNNYGEVRKKYGESIRVRYKSENNKANMRVVLSFTLALGYFFLHLIVFLKNDCVQKLWAWACNKFRSYC